MPIRVTVWGEYRHEKKNPKIAEIYPNGMHEAIADAPAQIVTTSRSRTATLDEPEHGLTEKTLAATDVLTWWGHMRARRRERRRSSSASTSACSAAWASIVLHSGHFSKIFRKLMGTTCNLKWREADEREILWVTRPGHPIVAGHRRPLHPRRARKCTANSSTSPSRWRRSSSAASPAAKCSAAAAPGRAARARSSTSAPATRRIPTYHDKNVLRVIENAVRWAAPAEGVESDCVRQPQAGLDRHQVITQCPRRTRKARAARKEAKSEAHRAAVVGIVGARASARRRAARPDHARRLRAGDPRRRVHVG